MGYNEGQNRKLFPHKTILPDYKCVKKSAALSNYSYPISQICNNILTDIAIK